jgi:hypothetical protein
VKLACQSRTLALRLRKLPFFIRIFWISPRNAGCCAVHLTVELDAAMQAAHDSKSGSAYRNDRWTIGLAAGARVCPWPPGCHVW